MTERPGYCAVRVNFVECPERGTVLFGAKRGCACADDEHFITCERHAATVLDNGWECTFCLAICSMSEPVSL